MGRGNDWRPVHHDKTKKKQKGKHVPQGRIKKLTDKGFGFIDTGKGKDLFFHLSALQGISFDDLREGQQVNYTEGQGQKGPCAENITVS